jgi:uncharacterized membrane protein YkgB
MIKSLIHSLANIDLIAKKVVRYAIVVVFLWIGALKFFPYEADGIVPFIANSPFMSEFYNYPEQYKKYESPEGSLIPKNHEWEQHNNTYGFSNGLGIFLIAVGLLVASYKIIPLASLVGSVLVFIMTVGTLSFLITTPEAWVPHLGDQQWGFPYLSGRGRLVIKDLVILGGSLLNMSESAQVYLNKLKAKSKAAM